MDKTYSIIVLFVIFVTGFCANKMPMDICGSGMVNLTCIRITLCPYALNFIVNKDLETLSKLNCGYEGQYPKVCCPKGEAPILYNITEETATNRPKPLTTSKPDVTTAAAATSFAPIKMVQTDLTFPNKTICGKSSGVVDRIVGGTITNVNEHPWLAHMQYKIDGVTTFGCSAALITDRFLLTAAHCVQKNKPISIRLGEWNTDTELDCYKGICNEKTIDVNLTKVIIHPTSAPSKGADGDIALIQLKEAVTFNDFVQPICLPTSKYISMQDYSRDSVYVTAGWGQTEFESDSVVKRQVQLKATSIEVCRSIYNLKAESEPNIICAGGTKGKDTCKGDSGGPLIKLVSEDYVYNWYLFGITSTGSPMCGAEGIPGMYTRVSAYMDWIRAVVSE